VVPILYGGELAGGVVFATGRWESVVYEPFLRSGLEAAVLASLVGGSLMLLLAATLSRRVERLGSGARLMERGDLSHRIEPGFGDELGGLAKALNSMAANLEESFSRAAEKDATLGAILDNLSEGVVATDAQGVVIFANPAGRAMLGIGEENAELPNPWEDFDLREAVATCVLKREGGEASVRGGKSFLRIKLEYVPNLGDGGRDGVLIVAQDLSEGRRLEEAQQKFLARAAHEFRTPLSAITFAAELLVAKGDDDPVARRRFLGHILAGTERMRRLSDSLLKLARVGWGAREPELEQVDLSDVVHAAAGMAESLAESAGLDVTVEGPSAWVVADPALLEQALLIPIANSIQHSDPGQTVRLRISRASVTVEDEAGGIAEEDLPHLFERFYVGKGSSGGTGLGLPICRDLVEKMGGEISIYSEKGVGTSVRIELPEAEPDA
jgi:PAS domain S-box-containing protein